MARTGENIYRRKDKRWEARLIYAHDRNGKALYRYMYAPTYAEAKRKLHDAAHLKYRPDVLKNAAAPFEQIVRAWKENVRLRVKASTFANYTNLTDKHIIPRFGKLETRKISTEMLERYIEHLLNNGRLDGKGGLSRKSAGDIFVVLKSIFKYAKREEQIEWYRLRIKKTPPDMRVLTRHEQERLEKVLLEDINPLKLGVLLSLYTGIRVGELCALRWADIDLAERTLRVHSTLQRIQCTTGGTKIIITQPKSRHSVRLIPLPDIVLEPLAQMQKNAADFVLTGESNRHLESRSVQYHFKRFLKRAGVSDKNYHCTRHTFATRCVELGFEIKSLSEILGHSVVNITLDRYVHSSFMLKRQNMDKLSLALKPDSQQPAAVYR